MEADPGGQSGTDMELNSIMALCNSKCRVVRAQNSIFSLNIIWSLERLLKADPEGQPGTDMGSNSIMTLCMSKCRVVRVQISIVGYLGPGFQFGHQK